MQFKLPHWIQVIAPALAAAVVAFGQQLPQYQAFTNVIAGILIVLGTGTGLHSPSITAVPGAPPANDNGSGVSKTGTAGFARLSALGLVLLVSGCLMFASAIASSVSMPSGRRLHGLTRGMLTQGCAAVKAAGPATADLGMCVLNYASDHPAISFESLVLGAALACSADVGAIVEAIIHSADPQLAQYRGDALAARDNPGKMEALRAHLAAAKRALGDAGPR